MDSFQKEHAHGSGICHSPAAITGRVPRCTRDFPPGDAPVGNLYGPLCPHLLPPGTRSTCPYLCLWPALGSGTQKRRIHCVSLWTRSPPPPTLRRLGRVG